MEIKFYTGILSDALHFDMGISYDDFIVDGFKNVENYSQLVSGRIYPVQGEIAEVIDLERVNRMLSEFPVNSFYFMKSIVHTIATFGDITSRFLATKNCAGAYITGKTRDVSLLSKKFPTFHHGVTCIDAYDSWDIKSFGEPISYRGITLSTEKFIFADRDAVLVVKEDWIPKMLAFAEDRLDIEKNSRKDIESGYDSYEVSERRGRW